MILGEFLIDEIKTSFSGSVKVPFIDLRNNSLTNSSFAFREPSLRRSMHDLCEIQIGSGKIEGFIHINFLYLLHYLQLFLHTVVLVSKNLG